jgi:hypothetical protein
MRDENKDVMHSSYEYTGVHAVVRISKLWCRSSLHDYDLSSPASMKVVFLVHDYVNTAPWRSRGLEVRLRECLSSVLGGGEWQASRLRRFNPDAHWIENWEGSRAGLDTTAEKDLYPCFDGSPNPRPSLLNLITTSISFELSGLRSGLFRRKLAWNLFKVEILWILWAASFTVMC